VNRPPRIARPGRGDQLNATTFLSVILLAAQALHLPAKRPERPGSRRSIGRCEGPTVTLRGGLAATMREMVSAGGKAIEVVRVRITAVGRRANCFRAPERLGLRLGRTLTDGAGACSRWLLREFGFERRGRTAWERRMSGRASCAAAMRLCHPLGVEPAI
jgi:hypothetical protein